VLNNPLANVDPLGLHDDCGGPCSDFSYQENGCTVIVGYYADDIGYDEPLISTYCPAGGPVTVSSGGGTGRGGKTQQSAPNNGTPWYKNACVQDALKTGAINAGVDAIGLHGYQQQSLLVISYLFSMKLQPSLPSLGIQV